MHTCTHARKHTHENLNGPRNFLRHQNSWTPPRSGCMQRESLFSGALKASLRDDLRSRFNLVGIVRLYAGHRQLFSGGLCRRAPLWSSVLHRGPRVNRHNKAFCLFSCLGWNIVYTIKYDSLESFVWPQATSFWPGWVLRNWFELRKRRIQRSKVFHRRRMCFTNYVFFGPFGL